MKEAKTYSGLLLEMAKRSSTRKSKGLFRRVYSPIHHLLAASRNVGRSLFRRSGRIVDEGLGAVQNVGTAVTSHANSTVRNIVSRKSRKNRKSRKSNSRKNRSSSK